MNKLLRRLIVAIVVVVVVQGGSMLIVRGVSLPVVGLPPVDFATMPKTLGAWTGEDDALDPKIFQVVGHDMLVNRIYKDSTNAPISLHCAVFSDYTVGINHNPMLCYNLSGWTLASNESWPVKMGDGKTVHINLMTWELKGTRVRVVYWFQIGDRFVKDKWDFGTARIGMAWERFQNKTDKPWPALIKVLIQTPASLDETADKQRLQDFVERVYGWTNDHYGQHPIPEGDAATEEPATIDAAPAEQGGPAKYEE